jgi:arylsulfatase A-like enzyme
LGEHRRVGMATVSREDTSLHEELVHVPCLVRVPGGIGAGDRSQALLQPADLAWTLADWFQLASHQPAPGGQSWLPLVRGEPATVRDRACMLADDTAERAIRTPAWHLILPAADNALRKLYAKPDDRWELNEVANRCGDVADLLAAALEEFQQASLRGLPPPASALPDLLVRGME